MKVTGMGQMCIKFERKILVQTKQKPSKEKHLSTILNFTLNHAD